MYVFSRLLGTKSHVSVYQIVDLDEMPGKDSNSPGSFHQKFQIISRIVENGELRYHNWFHMAKQCQSMF